MAILDWFRNNEPKKHELANIGISRQQFRANRDFWQAVVDQERTDEAWRVECARASVARIPTAYQQKLLEHPPAGMPHCADINLSGISDPNSTVREMLHWARDNTTSAMQWRWRTEYIRQSVQSGMQTSVKAELQMRFYFADGADAVHFKMRWA